MLERERNPDIAVSPHDRKETIIFPLLLLILFNKNLRMFKRLSRASSGDVKDR